MPLARRSSGCSSRSASRLRSRRSKDTKWKPAKDGGRSNWRSSKRATKRHARRQYDAVDPDNRLVAGELERRWNAALGFVCEREGELEALDRQQPKALSDEERRALLHMGADLENAWHHPAATAASRKRIVRAVLREIVVRIENEQIRLMLHWQGGDHTALAVKKNRAGRHRWVVEPETEALIRDLARLMPDKAIASLLNRLGKKTGRLNGWTQSRVCSFRSKHDIAVYRDGERAARGEVTLREAADILELSPMTVLRMIRSGILAAKQHCKGAPWVIRREDLDGPDLHARANATRKRPPPSNPDQQIMFFQ